jgi:hypothetical protein
MARRRMERDRRTWDSESFGRRVARLRFMMPLRHASPSVCRSEGVHPGSWRLIAVLLLALAASLARAGDAPFVITPESRPRGLVLGPAEGVF